MFYRDEMNESGACPIIFARDVLRIDCQPEAGRISDFIKGQIRAIHKEGAVIGLSSGVDSALAASLAIRVLGLVQPDKESSRQSEALALKEAARLGIPVEIGPITPVLEAFSTYEKRDAVFRSVFPDFGEGHTMKIALLADVLNRDALNYFTLTVIASDGRSRSARLTGPQARSIIAATCTKHRARMMTLYYFAEKANSLVCGTTKRSEAVQGLYVKYGDGGVDIEPIAHLYKS
jgi:NAD+ synthase